MHPCFKVLHAGLELLIGCLKSTSAINNLLLLSLDLPEALLCILLLFLQGDTSGKGTESLCGAQAMSCHDGNGSFSTEG